MYLNLHLLHALLNRRGLLGMGLGVYWVIVLVVGFRTHAGNELGDVAMMKKVGGQNSYGLCITNVSNSDCYTELSCPGCSLSQLYQWCKDSKGQIESNREASYPQQCAAVGGGPNCNPGNPKDVLCYIYGSCECRPSGEEADCVSDNSSVFCIDDFYVGTNVTCPYEPCP